MSYQLDPTGISPENKIIDEVKVITPPTRITDANFVVPNQTPFFKEGLVVKLGSRILVEGSDYQLIFRHIAASTHFERELFGGIMFINKQFTGTIKITYQVLGGEFANPDPNRITEFAKTLGKVRWVSFDQIIGVPSGFPPAYHTHDIETDLVDMGDVVDAVEKIVSAINQLDVGAMGRALLQHINSPSAHSKASVGLGNVLNYTIASLDEMKRGVSGRYVTPDVIVAWFRSLDISDFNIDLTPITTSINTLNSELTKLKKTVSELPTERTVSTWMGAISTDVNNRIDNFINNLATNEKFGQAVTSVYNKIPGKVDNRKVDDAVAEIDKLKTNMGKIPQQIQSIRDSLIEEMRNAASGTNTTLSTLTRNLSDITAKLTLVDSGVNNNNGSISQLTRSLSDLSAELESLRHSSNTYAYGNTGKVHNGRNVAYIINLNIVKRRIGFTGGIGGMGFKNELGGINIEKFGNVPEIRYLGSFTESKTVRSDTSDNYRNVNVDTFRGVILDRPKWMRNGNYHIGDHSQNDGYRFYVSDGDDYSTIRLVMLPLESTQGGDNVTIPVYIYGD